VEVTGLDARHGKANVVARAKIDSVYEVSRDIAGKKTAVHIEGGAQGSESQEYKRLHTYLLNATAALGDDEWCEPQRGRIACRSHCTRRGAA
jgi:hypothetical protein